MEKQIKCIDLLIISRKTKIPINKLTKEIIHNNIPDTKKIIYKNFPSIKIKN